MVELLALQYVFQYAAIFVKFRSLYVRTSHLGTYICCSSTSVILTFLVFFLFIFFFRFCNQEIGSFLRIVVYYRKVVLRI
jgi:hypothetical protein